MKTVKAVAEAEMKRKNAFMYKTVILGLCPHISKKIRKCCRDSWNTC